MKKNGLNEEKEAVKKRTRVWREHSEKPNEEIKNAEK